jgi:hypothetical protein
MSIPNTQNSVMGVTVRGANARRIIDSTASASRRTAASGDIVVAKITGGTTITGYDITCYPAYPATTASYAAKLAVPEIALGTELPVNTYIIAHKLSVEIIGGSMA